MRTFLRWPFFVRMLGPLSMIFCASSTIQAQSGLNPQFLWAERAGGVGSDAGRSVAVDQAGNVYVAGTFQGTATFGTTTIVGPGPEDVFLAKYGRNGNLIWVRQQAAKSFGLVGWVMAGDPAGNCYLTGYFFGTINFGTNSFTAGADHDLFLVKYDTDGSLVWARQLGGTSNELAKGISVDVQGNSYLTGYFIGTLAANGMSLQSVGFVDLLVVKYDPDGNLIWMQQGGGGATDFGNSIAVDVHGNTYVAGSFQGNAMFGDTTLTAVSPFDHFIAKLDPSGRFLWARKPAGSGYSIDEGNVHIASGPEGVTVAGQLSGTASFGATTLTTDDRDAFVARMDRDGNFLWAKQVSGSSSEGSRGLASDSNGNVFLAVVSSSPTVRFGGLSNEPGHGGNDVYVSKLDPSGNFLWAVGGGGAGFDSPFSVATDSRGGVFLTGSFEDSASFGTNTLQSAGGSDIFLARLNENSTFAPLIVVQPTNQTVLAGRDVAITVLAFGSPPPAYRWQFNGNDLLAETNARLTLVNVSTNDAGSYKVIAYNSEGSAVSQAAVLTVTVVPPSILVEPQSLTVGEGSDVTLSVVADGAPWPTYQWQLNRSNLAGATNASLLLIDVERDASGIYEVVVSNPVGTIMSQPAILAVTNVLTLADAVDAPTLFWRTGGDRPWSPQKVVSYDGIDAAQSGPIGNSQISLALATVEGPGDISFTWKVSCEQGFDKFRFYINDAEQTNITGEVEWKTQSFSVPPGVCSLKWVYQKDGSGKAGTDAAWLDQVGFVPGAGVTQPFYLAPIRSLPDGRFKFLFTGESARQYRIDASADLTNWTSIMSFTNQTGTLQSVDSGAADLPHRFYRGVLLP